MANHTAVPNDTALDKKSWTASASVADGPFVFSNDKILIDGSAANAIDGDHWTGWRDVTKTQYPGQWFQVDMKIARKFDRIELDNTWAQWDSPARYQVSVSNDGEEWGQPVATGPGKPGITSISFLEQARESSAMTRNRAGDWNLTRGTDDNFRKVFNFPKVRANHQLFIKFQ